MQEGEEEMEKRILLLSFLLPLHPLHSVMNTFAHPEFGKRGELSAFQLLYSSFKICLSWSLLNSRARAPYTQNTRGERKYGRLAAPADRTAAAPGASSDPRTAWNHVSTTDSAPAGPARIALVPVFSTADSANNLPASFLSLINPL